MQDSLTSSFRCGETFDTAPYTNYINTTSPTIRRCNLQVVARETR